MNYLNRAALLLLLAISFSVNSSQALVICNNESTAMVVVPKSAQGSSESFANGSAESIIWPRSVNLSATRANGHPDYYAYLGVNYTASADEIKKAYRELAMFSHPDRQANASPERFLGLEAGFKKFADAYDILGDAEKRARYDAGETYFGSSQAPYESAAPEPYTVNPEFWALYKSWIENFASGIFHEKSGYLIANIFNLGILEDPVVRAYIMKIARGEYLPEFQTAVIHYMGFRSNYADFRLQLLSLALGWNTRADIFDAAIKAMARNYEYHPDFINFFETRTFNEHQWHEILEVIQETISTRLGVVGDVVHWITKSKIPITSKNFSLAVSILAGQFTDPVARKTLLDIAKGAFDPDFYHNPFLYSSMKDVTLPSTLALRALIPFYDTAEVKPLLDHELQSGKHFTDEDRVDLYIASKALRDTPANTEKIRQMVEVKRGWEVASPVWIWHEGHVLTPKLLKLYSLLNLPKRAKFLIEIAKDKENIAMGDVAIELLESQIGDDSARHFLIQIATEDTYYYRDRQHRQLLAATAIVHHLNYPDIAQAIRNLATHYGYEEVMKLAKKALNL